MYTGYNCYCKMMINIFFFFCKQLLPSQHSTIVECSLGSGSTKVYTDVRQHSTRVVMFLSSLSLQY